MLVMIEDSNKVLSLQLLKVTNERLSMSGHIHSLGLVALNVSDPPLLSHIVQDSCAIGEHLRDATSVFDLTDVVLAAVAIDT